MASYIPAQRSTQNWESNMPTPGHRAPLMFPMIRSGSQRDYGGHHHGDPEFDTPVLNRTTDFLKRNVGNYLLYKGAVAGGTENVVKGEADIKEAVLHPDDARAHEQGALHNQPLPGAESSARTSTRGMNPNSNRNFGEPAAAPTTNMGGLFDRTPEDPTRDPAMAHDPRSPRRKKSNPDQGTLGF